MTVAAFAPAFASGCGRSVEAQAEPARHEQARARLCVRDVPQPCLSMEQVEATLSEAEEVLDVEALPHGSQGAQRVTLRAPRPLPRSETMRAKWRPLSGEGWSNAPLSEVLAYRLQKRLLAPRDYVVPPVLIRRMSVERRGAKPEQCGTLSAWVEGAGQLRDLRREGQLPVPPEGPWALDPRLYDAERFDRDERYRRNIGHVNLVAYLIGHGDAHSQQFVAYRRPLHLFLVDNSRAFGLNRNPQMGSVQDLSVLHVPAIPRETGRRLRMLAAGNLRVALGVSELREFSEECGVPSAVLEPRSLDGLRQRLDQLILEEYGDGESGLLRIRSSS